MISREVTSYPVFIEMIGIVFAGGGAAVEIVAADRRIVERRIPVADADLMVLPFHLE